MPSFLTKLFNSSRKYTLLNDDTSDNSSIISPLHESNDMVERPSLCQKDSYVEMISQISESEIQTSSEDLSQEIFQPITRDNLEKNEAIIAHGSKYSLDSLCTFKGLDSNSPNNVTEIVTPTFALDTSSLSTIHLGPIDFTDDDSEVSLERSTVTF
ncbi:MAG: hypothetical protein P1U74_08590 [Legionellaceae bacterium]|nr:hypothetical protein [Legionellaceae bacterium]